MLGSFSLLAPKVFSTSSSSFDFSCAILDSCPNGAASVLFSSGYFLASVMASFIAPFNWILASLYFTTYAAFVYYNLFPFGAVFAIMVLITIFTVYTAIRYNKLEIAILGMIGAYGIPFLISANSGRTDLFFAYIILINSGIVFLAYKRVWKAMVRLAMLVSWTLFIGWAFSRYSEALQMQAVVVMIVFYLMFTIASVAFAVSKKELLDMTELQLFLLNNIQCQLFNLFQ